MKKRIVGLAVSMITLLSGGLNAAQCSRNDNAKKVVLKNTLQEDVRFLVMDTQSPSTAGVIVKARPIIVKANQTVQIPYCKNGGTVMNVTAVGTANPGPNASVARVVTSGTVQGNRSYSDPGYGDMTGGQALNFSSLFQKQRASKSATITITAQPSTAGVIAIAHIQYSKVY